MKWNRRLAGRASRSCRTESAEQEDVRPEVAPARWGWFVWVMPSPGAGPVTTAPEPRRAPHAAVGARRAPLRRDPHEPPPASRPPSSAHPPTPKRPRSLGSRSLPEVGLAARAEGSLLGLRARAWAAGSLLGLGDGPHCLGLGSEPGLGLPAGARAPCSGSLLSVLGLWARAPCSGFGLGLPAGTGGQLLGLWARASCSGSGLGLRAWARAPGGGLLLGLELGAHCSNSGSQLGLALPARTWTRAHPRSGSLPSPPPHLRRFLAPM